MRESNGFACPAETERERERELPRATFVRKENDVVVASIDVVQQADLRMSFNGLWSAAQEKLGEDQL